MGLENPGDCSRLAAPLPSWSRGGDGCCGMPSQGADGPSGQARFGHLESSLASSSSGLEERAPTRSAPRTQPCPTIAGTSRPWQLEDCALGPQCLGPEVAVGALGCNESSRKPSEELAPYSPLTGPPKAFLVPCQRFGGEGGRAKRGTQGSGPLPGQGPRTVP